MSLLKRFILQILYINYCFSMKYYTNYTLYRATPVNKKQLHFFQDLVNFYDLDFWRKPGLMNMPVEFLVRPIDRDPLLADVHEMGINVTMLLDDVQRALDMQTVQTYTTRKIDTFNWLSFYRLDDIYNWMKDLSRTSEKQMEVFSIGDSHERRNILAARIVLKNSLKRSKVIIEGGIHAREWISISFVTYMLFQILHANYTDDENLKKIANTYEWLFIPVVNPDGYEYSHRYDRLWRKNRNGFGIDLNRNFATAFGRHGSDRKNLASSVYCGKAAFSEKEAVAVSQFVKKHHKGIEYYISFHSYGQYIIIPYAHLKQHLDNYEEVKSMGSKAATEIYRRHGTIYSVGSAYDTVGYLASGVSTDWAKETHKIRYTMTFELRDRGDEGFALSQNKIMPTCMETMDGMLSILTPRSQRFRDQYNVPKQNGGQEKKVLETIVLFINFLMFIILRFD